MTKLEFLRRQRGLTQTKLGFAIGVNPNLLSQIERGWRKPYPKLLQALATYFGVPIEEIANPDGSLKEVDSKTA
ncbi:helix-turn-helix domain protein [Caldicellulosiruptor kronotskyensis 2002]|uniref:Helix-turn-helix domain protein n=1 Tax=Caldicellulosiruptor kronotskyensis (strain DSM 18902 / VKM B-2412 / 2002) TaxID=632348 RepID=E4SB10_CALK2|nr:helix-turn-helix transcriptional regulator [Caldicellulosiruptor kronotskyensis]ADQ45665.1 helix-turn-helix domain protein [Caldicellulosiruptor kronotskyensis 2002]